MEAKPFIGIICGLKSEAAVVRAAVRDEKIRVAVSGANAKRAEELAMQMCTDGARAILSVGVSGGLDPALASGALLIGEKVVTANGDAWSTDLTLLSALEDESKLLGARRATLYGSDEIIADAAAKRKLFEASAAAVDMESHGVARAAARAGVPFIAFRAVADPADRALPPAALNAVAEDGSTRTLATLGAALRDPKQFPALIQLRADSDAALKTLRSSLGGLLGRLFLALDL